MSIYVQEGGCNPEELRRSLSLTTEVVGDHKRRTFFMIAQEREMKGIDEDV